MVTDKDLEKLVNPAVIRQKPKFEQVQLELEIEMPQQLPPEPQPKPVTEDGTCDMGSEVLGFLQKS